MGANAKVGSWDYGIVDENHIPSGLHDFLLGLGSDINGIVWVESVDHVDETIGMDFGCNHDTWMEC